MRSEQEMYDLIINFAKQDDKIRAVYLNGSRANPSVKKDKYQDYDIVYVVTDIGLEFYIENKDWINEFGEIMIMQEPDKFKLYEDDIIDWDNSYTYLMQFMDGNRIDLNFQSLKQMKDKYTSDTLTIPLLDKDNCLPKIPEASDINYHVKKPRFELFQSTCNEFWWVSLYIAKGLARKEILYAIDHLNFCVRPMLLRILSWYVGILTNNSLSVGKNNKYLDKYLPVHLYEKLLKTYPQANEEEVWESLFIAIDLFDEACAFVRTSLNYPYNFVEGKNAFEYLNKIRGISL